MRCHIHPPAFHHCLPLFHGKVSSADHPCYTQPLSHMATRESFLLNAPRRPHLHASSHQLPLHCGCACLCWGLCRGSSCHMGDATWVMCVQMHAGVSALPHPGRLEVRTLPQGKEVVPVFARRGQSEERATPLIRPRPVRGRVRIHRLRRHRHRNLRVSRRRLRRE